MVEGWLGNDYLILFDASEVEAASNRYTIGRWLPAHQVVGLRSWDDLLVKTHAGQVFAVPSVPASPDHVTPFPISSRRPTLSPDARFAGKIKWYVKPLAFGGDPTSDANITWVSHAQHGQLVVWWNEQYSMLKSQSIGA